MIPWDSLYPEANGPELSRYVHNEFSVRNSVLRYIEGSVRSSCISSRRNLSFGFCLRFCLGTWTGWGCVCQQCQGCVWSLIQGTNTPFYWSENSFWPLENSEEMTYWALLYKQLPQPPYSGVLLKWEFFIEMRAACFAPSFLHSFKKEENCEDGCKSHFNEKFSL